MHSPREGVFARSRDYALLNSYQMTSRVLYSAQYHRQHCTLQAFEQLGALQKHNPDAQPRDSNPSTSEF